VASNRARLRAALSLPREPLWLAQVHGSRVHRARAVPAGGDATPEADAAVTFEPERVLAVLTADCLPVVIARRDGTAVGIAHAGWRGLCAGVVEAACSALGAPAAELVAWLGPAIGPAAFEVGHEVRAAFIADDAGASAAFAPNARGRWQADLYALARRRLARAGVRSVTGGGLCTYGDSRRWYSYRRDGPTGRMATLAWLDARADTEP